MAEFMRAVWLYLDYLWKGITYSLALDPTGFEFVEQHSQAGWVVLGIVFLAGVSTLLGQSVILFVNRVRKNRFFISLAVNGLIFILSYAVWGLTVWLAGRILFSVNPPIGQFLLIVGLSTAPLVFGFFILIPWMGPFIGKLLNIWSLLILLRIVEHQFQIGFWGALLCVGLGWLLSLALNNTIGRPIVALRDDIWRRVTGSSLDASAQDILQHLGETGADPLEDGAR